MSTSPPRRPLRADARRNVELLLAAAREVFREQGVDAPLDEVARRAGVGNATLYRRFPTRQALLEAVHQDLIEALHVRARALLEDPSPAEAPEVWLRELAGHGSSSRGLTATLTAALHGQNAESVCRELVVDAAGALLERAQRAGAVRSDVTVVQVLRLVNAVAFATEHEPDGPRQAEHLLGIVMDGLRHGSPAPSSPR